MIDRETIEKLVFGLSCREVISDVRKCEEERCMEPGLEMIKPDGTKYYLCPLHGIDFGFCESCGRHVEDLGHRKEPLCDDCLREGVDGRDDGDGSDLNDFGTGNPDEPYDPLPQ